MPKDYDIQSAFREIENELLESMFRNLNRHKAWEEKEGINWEQWQVLQLKALEEYKAKNSKVFNKRFDIINAKIKEAIEEARKDGNLEQELEILKQIQDNKFKATKMTGPLYAAFLELNDKKLEALIKATTDDLEKAEHAMLRMANDQYRKIIFNAQVYANTGAATYEKAVDMASRDFLKAGINCIEYKNGARHTIEDYADMAIRTASKRAKLTGEGEMRKKWGIATVIMNKRGNPCPKCLPWAGKVLIDDVWSGGSSKDGKYPLMSTAIEAGLYHPRCKDGHTTYFEGITEAGAEYTRKEIEEITDEYNRTEKMGIAKRNYDRYQRLEKYSLDEENKREYAAKAESWKEELETLRESAAYHSLRVDDSKEFVHQEAKVFKEFRKKYLNAAEEVEKSLANTGGSSTIYTKIHTPISQRNTGKGNPNAILLFDVELNNRQEKILNALTEYDSRVIVKKSDVKLSDLSALTAKTGVEFALFTKDNLRLVVRGDAVSVNIGIEDAKKLAEEGYKFSGHTHPGTGFNVLMASGDDYEILKAFNQKRSVTYNSKGDYLVYELDD